MATREQDGQARVLRPRLATDLTDVEWLRFRNLLPLHHVLPPRRQRGRPRSDLREVINAMLYRARTNCAWAALPDGLPPKSTVYAYYRRWQRSGDWPRVEAALCHQLSRHSDLDPTWITVRAIDAPAAVRGPRRLTDEAGSTGAGGCRCEGEAGQTP